MPKRARVQFASLHSSLVNLPISIYGPLLERGVRPQHLGVHFSLIQNNGVQRDSKGRTEAYVGWTGMASASSLAHFNAAQSGEGGFETVEIDPQFAQGLGFAQGDIVEIGLLYDLPHAKSVGTEPLTSDDWEIIEIHATHLENTLLSQVRVVKIGQEIDVWVLGRTRVRLRVTSVDPVSKGNVLILTTNTEVSVAPKVHNRRESASKSSDERSSSPEVVDSESSSTPQKSCVLRVLPARLSPSLPEYAGPELLAFVSPGTLSHLQIEDASLDSSTFLRVVHRRLPPPLDPSSSSSSSDRSDPPIEQPAPRVLHAGGREQVDQTQDTVSTEDLYLGVADGIVTSHIVFPVLPKGVEDWDIVSISPSTNDARVSLELSGEQSLPFKEPRSRRTLVGIDDALERCRKFGVQELLIQSLKNSCHGFSGLLVTGRSGAGKTSIVKFVGKLLEEDIQTLTYVHYVDVSTVVQQPISSLKAHFHYWFYKCSWHKPSVLILDNLDKLLSAEVEHADSFRSRHLTELFLRIFSSAARTASFNSRGILLVATADSTASLHSLINRAHIFREVVHLTPPNKQARRDILKKLVDERLELAEDIDISSHPPVNFTELSTQTEGYSITDLKDLVSRAIHHVAVRAVAKLSSKLELTQTDFVTAQVDFVPLSLRDVKLEKPDVSWCDIGGLSETKRILRETLEWPNKYGPIFKQAPLRLRSGLLLYGYPGCGKTLLASAVAKECGLNFISVKGPEILNKYIGASEKSVRNLFERASAAKPCVLFFDEFDSIAPKRGHDSTGVTDRVVNQMLTQMDGAEGLDGVYVLAATSRPDLIDSALLRPGRLDKSLLCNLPTAEERQDILKAVSRKLTIASDVDFSEIARKTEGFSGADLQALLYNAHLEVIHSGISESLDDRVTSDKAPLEYVVISPSEGKSVMTKAEKEALERRLRQMLNNSSSSKGDERKQIQVIPQQISQTHISKALKLTRPSISSEERNRLDWVYEDFISGRSASHPVPVEAGGVGHRLTLG